MPAAPHVLTDWEAYTTHVLPLQHPLGHELASHLQTPPMHTWPLLAQPPPHVPQLFTFD